MDAVAVLNEGGDTVTLFVLNRSMEEDIALSCDLRSVKAESCICHTALEGYGYEEANSALEPDRVVPSHKPTDILEKWTDGSSDSKIFLAHVLFPYERMTMMGAYADQTDIPKNEYPRPNSGGKTG